MRMRRSSGSLLRAAVVAFLLLALTRRAPAQTYSSEESLLREPIGGVISVPGVPFPVPQGSVEDAIPIYESILKVVRLGGEGPALGRGLGYLAGLYGGKGDFARAEELYGQAQAILERNGVAGRDLGWVHNNRGMTRLNVERFAEAAQSFHRALKAIGETGDDENEPRAIVWQNLASAYHLLGDAEASEQAYLSALGVLRGMGQDRGRTYQATVNNLAVLYGSIGDFTTARRLLEDLLARGGIREPSLHLAVLADLGDVLRSLKDFPGAEQRLNEALKLAGTGARRAMVLMSLSATHADSGDLAKACSEAEEALDLLKKSAKPESHLVAGIEATLGSIDLFRGDLGSAEARLTKSKESVSKGTARDRWLLSDLNRGLALVAERQGRHARALEFSRLALDQEITKLDQILAFGSESQRLAYQRNAYLYDYLAEIGDAPLLAEAVLRLKGVVLDSLLEERAIVRRAAKPEDRERLARIHGLKVEAMESLARGGAGRQAREEGIARALKQEETALAKSVAIPLRAERPPFDLAKIQGSLGADQVLVEFMRHHLSLKGGKLEPRYGAVMIPRSGRPCWVPLGRADELDGMIEKVVHWMDGGDRGAQPDLTDVPPGDAETTLRKLFDQLWRPLVAKFPTGTKRVLLSPDGALHFVPWAALIDDKGAFVAESWQISQTTSGRDLLRPLPPSESKAVLALADGTGDLRYARVEAETLARMAQANDWAARVLTGDQATERALFAQSGPGILHLATHGGQLRGDFKSAIQTRLSRQPMYRAYVLLGGAQQSLEAWGQGVVPALSSDGILTAEEVGGLDLSRTWLTVLSACQTGSGESIGGEGVLGLRRGFALAGTQNLLFTLWSVDDRATAQFMERFYERLFATKDPALAFAETQLARLRQLRESHEDLRWAVAQAGGFVLTR